MHVEIIKDENNKPIGWSMQGENKEEINKLCDIRNLQFFGFDDTAIEYNGRKEGNDNEGNPGILSWIQRKFSSDGK
jgi:hypothetical protein